MENYIFIFNLETGEIDDKDQGIHYAIRYNIDNSQRTVEVGDGLRHEIFVDGVYWNRILKIIKNDELDETGIKALLGLMDRGLPQEYKDTFISAVKSGAIKEI